MQVGNCGDQMPTRQFEGLAKRGAEHGYFAICDVVYDQLRHSPET